MLIYLLLSLSRGISLPGIQSPSYEVGENVPTIINEMSSASNQIPYDYYMLEFCQPVDGVENKYENIGSLLMGSRSQNSPYNIYMSFDQLCEFVCQVNLTDYDVNNFKWFIDHDYRTNMEVDGLPVVQNISNTIEIGTPIGYKFGDTYYIYNHIQFEIETYTTEDKHYINKILATPVSMGQSQIEDDFLLPQCMDQINDESDFKYPMSMKLNKGVLFFTYDIAFTNVASKSDRWQIYKQLDKEDTQWLSLSLTFLTTFILTIIVALMLRMIIRRDILKFERLPNNQEDNFDEMGWKQVSRDVFKPPKQKMLLSVLLGTGIQLMILIICTIFLSCIGFVYQAHSGNLATLVIVIYVFTGSLNGYYTAKYYKYFKGEYWLLCTLSSNLAYPLMALFVYVIQHIFLILEDSSSGFSLKAAITFIALQIGIQTPLNLIGSFIGYKVESSKNPCKYYAIAQYIPPQPWYLDTFYCCLIGGFICFVSIGLELGYIMSLIWQHSYYEFFASLFMSLILLFIISAEVSILFVYVSLVKQNHRWWWKSFFIPFSAGIYLFVYSFQYYLASLSLTRLSAILYYFGTMYLASLTLGLVCGTIGFVSSLLFVKRIYSLIKVD